MPGLVLPTVRVAAVQAAPAFLDLAATLDKVDALVAKAAGRGAGLLAFGEAFVPGFPIWNGVLTPADQHWFHERLVGQSIVVPGAETERLGRLAARWGVVLSIGVSERSDASLGQLWNSNLVFDRAGQPVNHRRKLVASWYERLTWLHCDTHDLVPAELDRWRLGALICGENTNALAGSACSPKGSGCTWPVTRPAGRSTPHKPATTMTSPRPSGSAAQRTRSKARCST